MEVKGNIKVINPTQVVSEKFSKRELVITTNDTYPQDILIQFTQDKCSILDSYKVGQNVNVSLNLRGREWTSSEGVVRHFNNIEGWKIENVEDTPAPPPAPQEEEEELF